MPRKLERPAAPYVQIADDIREAIRSGELAPGELAPSVRTISRDYGVAHATAYRAITSLQSEGYLRPQPGMGNVVTTEEERGWSASARLERSRRTGRIYPTGQHAKIINAGVAPAPEQAASVYGVKSGSPLVRRERITYRDDHPISHSVSWFPGDLAESAPKLLESARIIEGTFAYIASVTGRQLGAWRDQYEPANATRAEASWLAIEPGRPILRGRNWVYDTEGDVLEYGESVQSGRVMYRGEMSN